MVVAHPGDETAGCGALLSRLAGACVIVLTSGGADGDAVTGAESREGGEQVVFQSFPSGSPGACLIALSAEEISLKRRMIAAHASRKDALSKFRISHEWYRPAPMPDFDAPPNDERLLYERDGVLTSERWLSLAAAAMKAAERGMLT